MKTLSLWFLTIIAQMMYQVPAEIGISRRYSLLFDGGQQVNATYLVFKSVSKINCGEICNGRRPRCWLFAWDENTRNCSILGTLTSMIGTMVAPVSQKTYYVSATNRKDIFVTPNKGTWHASRLTCESMGGHLFLPEDNSYAYILHYVYNITVFWTGMYRNTSGPVIWRDINGNVLTQTPLWFPGEPDIPSAQYTICLWKGLLSDMEVTFLYNGLCEAY